MVHRWLLAAAGLAGMVASVPCFAADQAVGTLDYFHFKEKRTHNIDGTRVAVEVAPGFGIADVRAVLIKAGLDPAAAVQSGLASWHVVSLQAGKSGVGFVQAAIRELVQDRRIAFASPVFLGMEGLQNWPTRDIMVHFAQGVAGADRGDLLAAIGAKSADYRWQIMPDAARVTLNVKDGFAALAAANQLALRPETVFAECDLVITGHGGVIPNDPTFNQSWGLHNTGQSGGVFDRDMDGPEAWDMTTGLNSVITVVMDMGIDAHPDLNLAPGADFTGNGTNGAPLNACDNHGVNVAGCISGIFNNAVGTCGIAPATRTASAKIGVSQTPCNGFWNGQLSWSADAINWAATTGARVTNNSNSYGGTSSAVESAYLNTYNNNQIVHFASAGNSGAGSLAYPSSIAVVNSVAALTRTGSRSSFSQFGAGLDFSAPGSAILTTDRVGAAGNVPGDFDTVSGTSFSSPYAAGVAALVRSRNPSLSAPFVEAIMRNTCVDLGAAGSDTDFGAGFVNAAAAVFAATPPPVNNLCAGAQFVTPGTYNGTLHMATNDGTATCGSSSSNPDVWYEFTAPGAGTLTVTTCGSNAATGIDTVLSFHSACGGAAYLCNDDSSNVCTPGQGTLDSALSTTLGPGGLVKIRVSKFGTRIIAPFILNVNFVLANDACSNAIDVSAGGNHVGTLVLATNDGTASCGSSATNPDVWYSFTNTSCNARILTVRACGSNSGSGIDTVLSIHSGCGGTQLACNDDSTNICAPNVTTLDSVVSAPVAPGQNVKIRVSKFSTRIVNFFFLQVSSAGLANDLCANALPVSAGNHGFCNNGAVTDGPTACGGLGSDVWYRYTPTVSGLVALSTCGTGASFDSVVAVYPNSCPPGAAIACNDDDFNVHCSGGSIRDAWLQFNGAAGTTYLIRVGGFSSAQGSGTLQIVPPPTCVADVDDGSGTGTPDGGVTIEDLIYYLEIFDAGLVAADVDDGSSTGTPDGGVTIDDLIYFLARFDVGC